MAQKNLVDLPNLKMVIFHSYCSLPDIYSWFTVEDGEFPQFFVCLPEGNWYEETTYFISGGWTCNPQPSSHGHIVI